MKSFPLDAVFRLIPFCFVWSTVRRFCQTPDVVYTDKMIGFSRSTGMHLRASFTESKWRWAAWAWERQQQTKNYLNTYSDLIRTSSLPLFLLLLHCKSQQLKHTGAYRIQFVCYCVKINSSFYWNELIRFFFHPSFFYIISHRYGNIRPTIRHTSICIFIWEIVTEHLFIWKCWQLQAILCPLQIHIINLISPSSLFFCSLPSSLRSML